MIFLFWFTEAQRELIGLAADFLVEDIGGARVVGVLVEVAFGLELEARLGQRRDHRVLVDPVQAVGQCRAAALRRAMVDDHQRAAGFERREQRRSEEHTSELQSLMRISYAVFCLQKNTKALNPFTNKEITS